MLAHVRDGRRLSTRLTWVLTRGAVCAALGIATAVSLPASRPTAAAPGGDTVTLHLATGWNLIAGSSSGIGSGVSLVAQSDSGQDYVPASGGALNDFRGYWLYAPSDMAISVEYPMPQPEAPRRLLCRSDQQRACMATADTVETIPVMHDRWVLIGNSTAKPLKLANIFYDVRLPSGFTATYGYRALVYDPLTAEYADLAPVLADYRGHPLQTGVMLLPGQGAWVWSPIDYVFLEAIPDSP